MKFQVIDLKNMKWADPEKIALEEAWADGLIYCDMEGFSIGEDGALLLMDECGAYRHCPEGRFQVVFA